MLAPGTTLGRYTIEALIGAGGMGEVYRARDEQLGRAVAIKILPSHLHRDAAAMERFRREARSVAALSHPNILSIFDFASTDDLDYAVTELLEGDTLGTRLRERPLTLPEALALMTEICSAVAAAHARGIVHRDLKPHNIFITTSGRIKVLDFGLARTDPALQLSSGGGKTDVMPSVTGFIVGTVGYLSPEQIEQRPVRPPSDVFALGCVLFEMITGRLPFEADTPIGSLMTVINQPTPRLSGRDPLLAKTNVVLQRSLAKEESKRYPDAGAMGEAIEGLLRSDDTSRFKSTTPIGVQLMPERSSSRWLYGLGVMIVVLALAASGWWLHENKVVDAGYAVRRSDLPRGEARRLVELALSSDASGNRPRAVGLLEEACRRDSSNALACAFAASFEGASGRATVAATWAGEARKRIETDTPPYEALLVRYLTTSGDANLERQLALANSILTIRPEAWRLRLGAAHILLNRRDRNGALAQLKQIDVRQPDDRRLAVVLADRASLGDVNGAVRDLERSPLQPAMRAYVTGRIEWSRGNAAASHAAFEECVAAAAAAGNASVELEARILSSVALLRLGKTVEAEAAFGKAAAVARQAGLPYRELQATELLAYVAHLRGDIEERDRRFLHAFTLASRENRDESAALLLLALRLRASIPPDVNFDESDATMTGARSLIAARTAYENGDRAGAQRLLLRARNDGVELSDFLEESELLAAQLGLQSKLLPPDPPYPILLRYLAIFELEDLKRSGGLRPARVLDK